MQEAQKRENILYDRIERDYLVFRKLEEAKHEMEKLVPKFKFLEKEINTISNNNSELKRKYDCIKIENKCLTCLLNRLYKKNWKIVNDNSIVNNNSIVNYNKINNDKIYTNKSLVLKTKNLIESNNNKLYTKIPYTSRYNLNNNSFKSPKLSLSKSTSKSTIIPSNSINFKKQIKNKILAIN